MSDPTSLLSEKLEGAARDVEKLLSIPQSLISQYEAELSELNRRQSEVDKAIASAERQIREYNGVEQENRGGVQLSEDECRKLLPVMSKLTLSEARRGEDGKMGVFVGKLACSPDFIEKNWEIVGEALKRINS